MLKVTESRLDDLNQTEGAAAVEFGFEGKTYVVDLAEANHDALREFLAPYIAVARPQTAVKTTKSSATADIDLADLRTWAAEKGIVVAPRGRIATKVVDDYRADKGL